ncbi:TolC family protein [Fulvivirga sediminis]|uniref:TolC family protein n=1 Tax=Fulvivirga sediminis TaxID=2803949 RepID=A0A937FC57_9BACT|nr:TolC family protein [Fulvivirga sediminis]MBL3657853.1 TolC family protein [Fulvivirga sediminis]
MKKSCLIALMGFFTFTLYAQDEQHLNLKEAVELGLENSKSLKVAYASAKEAEAKYSESKMDQYPELSISGAHMRVNKPHIETHLGGEGQGEGSTVTPDVSSVTYGMADLTQPLFSGFRIRNAVKMSEYLKRASELDVENEKEEVVFNVISAYYNFYKLLSTQNLVKQSLNEAEERVKLFTSLEANGVITRNDLLKAQLQKSNMELNLLEVNNNIDVANYNLGILLGLEDATIITIDTAEISKLSANEVNEITYYMEQAGGQRNDLEASKNRELAANNSIKIAKGSYYPSLALTAGYVDAHIPNVATITNAVNVGLGLQYNLSSLYKGRSHVQQAQARADQASIMADMQWDNVRREIYRDYANYQNELKKLQTLEVASSQATENYRITNNSYKNSVALLTDVLEAQVQQLQAQVNEMHAKADATISYYQLAKDSGILSEEVNIEK